MGTYDWRAARDRAMMNRRREGRTAVGGGSREGVSKTPYSFDFYARWCFDSVMEMLYKSRTETEAAMAAFLYSVLMEYNQDLDFIATWQIGGRAADASSSAPPPAQGPEDHPEPEELQLW